MFRIIREVKPAFVVCENVVGLISLENGKPFEGILNALENEGYKVESFIIPACGVGAWHRRDRIWIIAYLSGIGLLHGQNEKLTTKAREQTQRKFITNSEDDANTSKQGLQRSRYKSGQQKIQQENGTEQFCGNSDKFNDDNSGHGAGKISQFKTSKIFKNSSNSKTKGLEGTNSKRDTSTRGRDLQLLGRDWWAVEPELGGRFNGLPTWLHRHNIKGFNYEESIRRTEILRTLWNDNVSQTIWKVIGGFDLIQKSEILFTFVCEYEKNPNKARLFLESKKAFEEFVRNLWIQGKITGSSYRSKNRKQFSGKHTDIMQELSRILAYSGKENWQISSWEDGIPRVADNISNRVERLKGLGNAVIPQLVLQIFKAIQNYEDNYK